MRNTKPETRRRGTPDFQLLILTLLLVGFGVIMVFSASSSVALLNKETNFDSLYFVKRQAAFAILGLFIMLVTMNIKMEKYKKLFVPLFFITILLLVIVLFTGSLNGAKSWLRFGSIGFQPTELAKISIILYLSALIVKKGDRFRDLRTGYIPVTVIVGFVAGLIMLQPDFGSCFILVATSGLIIYAGGASIKHITASVALLVLGASIVFGIGSLFGGNSGADGQAVAKQDYKIGRFQAFLNPMEYKLGVGYNLVQSLQAIGDGGLSGAGFGKGIIKLHYLPNSFNDFIFSVIGEEFGFIGTAIFLMLYLYFIWRGMLIALRCHDPFGTLVGTGIMGLIAIQAFINIGGVTQTIPITGVTLPFISFGGSSLLVTMFSMGIMLSISRENTKQAVQERTTGVAIRNEVPNRFQARRTNRYR
ncbi:putative lipid II flippase FtsW [Paenibacillus brasilensis]|uniref:Probable peptidoglycan glycosyltransferase FtsW n=1 Tax=Paenibacillus brasilensis TaxID=128574 RepID=A0ABU0KUC2_9BACL|nr:putative lipid II flippase FtsW [Paenibacillus brasilensis]MDQ0492205.1 cell division protein FtsW [Paenibacillus brasilensis]